MKKAKQAALKSEINTSCRSCKADIVVTAGINTCPACGEKVDVKLNFK